MTNQHYPKDNHVQDWINQLGLNDNINYLYRSDKIKQTHIITPRIFKSSTIELLKKAKQLFNSDKTPLSFMIDSNVGHSALPNFRSVEL